MILPSRYQLGDIVRVAGYHGTHPITGVCFRAGTTFYEVMGIMFTSDFVFDPLKVVHG